jgi:mono/diheme cytochrome c family protein
VFLSARLRFAVWALWMTLVLGLVLSTRTIGARAQSTLAERAKTILTERCFKCHGQNGVARKNIFVLDRERLIASKMLTPGDANSPLLQLVESNEMPLGGPPLSSEEKAALRDWVGSGALAWKLESKPAAPPVS